MQLFAIFFRNDANCLSVITIRKRTIYQYGLIIQVSKLPRATGRREASFKFPIQIINYKLFSPVQHYNFFIRTVHIERVQRRPFLRAAPFMTHLQ